MSTMRAVVVVVGALALAAGAPALVVAHDVGGDEAHERFTEADVARVQRTLDGLGYSVGGVDGELGARTRTAIRNFQRDENLNATGELDRETLAALDADTSGATSGTD